MKIVLNEKELLSKSLKSGHIDKKPSITIRILAKHFFNIGQNKEQVIDSIDSFMEKHQKGYNYMDWHRVIKGIVNKIDKLEKIEFIDINNIIIYLDELEVIKNINNLRLEKLAFVLLVYSKIYNQLNKNDTNWVNSSLSDIFSDTKMAVSKKDQNLMINKLIDLKLLDVSKIVDCTNIKILFAKNNGEIAFEVKDFRDFVLEYLRWKGEKVGNCEGENCGRLIAIRSNSQKYCKDCWKEHRNEYQRELMRKKRNC